MAATKLDRLLPHLNVEGSVHHDDPGRKPVPLHFDFSYNYYPTAYFRPGPEVKLYRLNGCREQFGKVPEQPIGYSGLDKGVGTSYVPGAK